ncbi:uncharacterized protein Z518_00060 [Rhinocladiella mackenziei CBS 650.93]|uniref:Chromo domain-containing protein n=1 Tax=Rhinocladiella mackenziei CBS 650.93 TaxID=1442369 RepID=A0A0D2G360_9EURO|nr:uncharacterized protein Z518_00060 [Rhinocladiella mackenziei CBS 650.93]KIX08982.1 hypothetical protein Z518_00060 [Rhinocladiella mackenziei CBS 650.93]
MNNSTRNNFSHVEYNSTKRKKPAEGPTVHSKRASVPLAKPRRSKKSSEDSSDEDKEYPALAIIGERFVGKDKREKQYLVDWVPRQNGKPYPPSWEPASFVNEALLEDWERTKKERATSGTHSHGQPIVQGGRRTKHIRGLPDSSSEAASPHSAKSSSGQVANSSKPRASSRLPSVNPDRRASSPIEIAETQQDVSQPLLIPVSIPPANISKADHGPLHRSPINSDGGLKGCSSPSQRQNYTNSSPSSQPGPDQSPSRRRGPVPISSTPLQESSLPGRSNTPRRTHRTESSTSRQARSPHRTKGWHAGVDSTPLTLRSQKARSAGTPANYPPPLPRGTPSSDISSGTTRYVTPEFPIPTTQDLSTRTREPSVEFGSDQGRGIFTNTVLTENPVQDPYPQNTFAQFPDAAGPSPWNFRTQAEAPASSFGTSAPGTPHTNKRYLEAFLSPNRLKKVHHSVQQNMSPSPVPSAGPGGSTQGSTLSPQTWGERIKAARASAQDVSCNVPQVTDSDSKMMDHDGRGPNAHEMDLSGNSATTSPVESRHYDSRGIPESTDAPQSQMDDVGGSAFPIQRSIEEEQQSSNGEQSSTDSKASSSQQSVDNERDIPLVDGLVIPSLPILGPDEYAIALPAEGKIQSAYFDIIKSKRKSILKFISRHDSVGSSNGSPHRAHERNEMTDMIQQLHNTTTHFDLGLPGFSAQDSMQSDKGAAYANYAGSKFSFLGHLVDIFKHTDHSIVIVSRAGPIQDLLEQYLTMNHVKVRRQDRLAASRSPPPDRPNTEFQVELVSSMSTHQVSFPRKPVLMIAFDASFDSQDPQVARIRTHFSPKPPALIPVVHLLVSNSSEHVDRCIPRSVPSPKRLKMLVRATYQARPNLGGKPTYVPDASDEPEGRPMDFSDLQRALRKRPERKLRRLAQIVVAASMADVFATRWTLGSMPGLQLTELEEPLPKASGTSTVAETPKESLLRSATPISRADTPSGRKRLLEVDGILPALNKRQRLTPLRDSVEINNSNNDSNNHLAQLQELVRKLQAELTTEREARQKSEHDRDRLQEQLDQWKKDHADLQRRYEKRMTKCHELDKANQKLLKTIENNQSRHEKTGEDNVALKKKVAELQAELETVRTEVKSGGGDAAAVEVAREEARMLLAKNIHLERSLENTRKDFEFTRSQYQDASNKAAEFATQVRELEEIVTDLTKQAADEKRRLKETNFEDSVKKHLAKISELELEKKSRDMLLRKLEEENRSLKRNRGVQTRGSSVQPPGSPGLDGHGTRGPRSRQGSPAPGLFAGPHHASGANRGSLLRHER